MLILDTMYLSNISGNVTGYKNQVLSPPHLPEPVYSMEKDPLFFLCTSEVAQKAKDKACALCLNLRAVGEKKGKN